MWTVYWIRQTLYNLWCKSWSPCPCLQRKLLCINQYMRFRGKNLRIHRSTVMQSKSTNRICAGSSWISNPSFKVSSFLSLAFSVKARHKAPPVTECINMLRATVKVDKPVSLRWLQKLHLPSSFASLSTWRLSAGQKANLSDGGLKPN